MAYPANGGTVRWNVVCLLRNVHEKMADGKTAYEKRCGVKFDGPLIPFGAQISYKPTSSKDEAKLHPFGKRMHPGIFTGNVLRAGEDEQAICSSQIAKTLRQTDQAPRSRRRKKAVVSMCRRICQALQLPQPPRGEKLAKRNPDQDEKKRTPFSMIKTRRRLLEH